MDWSSLDRYLLQALVIGALALAAVLVGAGLGRLQLKRARVAEWLRVYGESEWFSWRNDQEWRNEEADSIRLLANWKKELREIESYLLSGREAARRYIERMHALAHGGMLGPVMFLFEKPFYDAFASPYDPAVLPRGYELCARIDRVWSGDTFSEVEDRNDEKRRLLQLDPSGSLYGDRVLQLDRELKDLEEIVRRRTRSAGTVSPDDANFAAAREIRRNDMRMRITEHFLSFDAVREIHRERDRCRREVADDPNMTEVQKQWTYGMIEEETERALKKFRAAREKPGS